MNSAPVACPERLPAPVEQRLADLVEEQGAGGRIRRQVRRQLVDDHLTERDDPTGRLRLHRAECAGLVIEWADAGGEPAEIAYQFTESRHRVFHVILERHSQSPCARSRLYSPNLFGYLFLWRGKRRLMAIDSDGIRITVCEFSRSYGEWRQMVTIPSADATCGADYRTARRRRPRMSPAACAMPQPPPRTVRQRARNSQARDNAAQRLRTRTSS